MNEIEALSHDEIQPFGTLASASLGIGENHRASSVAALNTLLAHTMALRDLYKKAHWQTSGITFIQLHELFDRHHAEQLTLMDALAERVQMLGGVTLALAADVVSESRLARNVPRGKQTPEAQLRRLVASHEVLLVEARPCAGSGPARRRRHRRRDRQPGHPHQRDAELVPFRASPPSRQMMVRSLASTTRPFGRPER